MLGYRENWVTCFNLHPQPGSPWSDLLLSQLARQLGDRTKGVETKWVFRSLPLPILRGWWGGGGQLDIPTPGPYDI